MEVGNVHFMRRDKSHSFQCLLPVDNPSNECGVPENHVRLVPHLSSHIDRASLGCNARINFDSMAPR
jgi:hypothetical protein